MTAYAEMSRSVVVRGSTITRVELAGSWGKWRVSESARLYAWLGGDAIVETRQGRTRVQAGDLMFLPRGCDHVVREPGTRLRFGETACIGMTQPEESLFANTSCPETVLVIVEIATETIDAPWLALLPDLVTIRAEGTALDRWLRDTLALLATAHAVPAAMHHDITMTWAHALFAHALERAARDLPGLDLARDARIVDALVHVREHPEHDWTLHTLAETVGLSRSVLAERMGLLLGEPLGPHLRRLRLDKATALLVSTDLPVKAIAARVGYDSEPAFARAFMRDRQCSPGELRRRHA